LHAQVCVPLGNEWDRECCCPRACM
jgi:hypothetical protein